MGYLSLLPVSRFLMGELSESALDAHVEHR
jgi:hypothetical protein